MIKKSAFYSFFVCEGMLNITAATSNAPPQVLMNPNAGESTVGGIQKRLPHSNNSHRSTANAKRQAISGMIVTIILIGIVVSIGGILATTTTDLVQTGLVLDAVEIKRLNIQNTGTESYITGMIKNSGNTDIVNAQVIVRFNGDPTDAGGTSRADSDKIFVMTFSPTTINSGISATVNQRIIADSNENCRFTASTSEPDKNAYRCTPGGAAPGATDVSSTVLTSTTVSTGATEHPVRLAIGQEYQVEIRATIVGGGEYSQTKILTPQ